MLDSHLRQVISTDPSNLKIYNRFSVDVPGMSWIPLSGELHNGEFECFLLRMEAGMESKPHEHMGDEAFLVLDGELIDCDGTQFNKGDYVHYQPGTKHSSTTPNGCTILVILRGINRALSEDEIKALKV